jgi:ABC-type transport system involved in multi-copper enzyme maturation permease subunit
LNRQIATIARYTLIEALRTRLPLVVLVAVALLIAASLFVREIAIAESARMQTGFYAAGARFAAVFIAAFCVLASMSREFHDRVLDNLLALDLPRAHYILGKLAGFIAAGALIALAASLPLAWLAGPLAALQWGISLALETAILVALALFCVVTFSQFVAAAGVVTAFYLLARALTAIRLMSAEPLSGADTLSHQVIELLVDAISLVMPAFDRWTQTAWLVGERAGWPELGALALQGLIYLALLGAAAMFDFYRRNF